MSARMIRGGAVAAILVVVLGAASTVPWAVRLEWPAVTEEEQLIPVTPSVRPALPPELSQLDAGVTDVLGTILVVLLLVAAGLAAGYAVFRLVRRLRAAWRPDDDVHDPDALDAGAVSGASAAGVDVAALATAVARAEALLAGRSDPADAVTAAWVALEDEAALQGTSHHPAQTSTEFTSALLTHSPAPEGAVATLLALYHRARFTTHTVTPHDVESARESLATIAAALDAGTQAVAHHPEEST